MTSSASLQGATVVLASASPARLAVLRAAGIDPVVRVSAVDEDAALEALAGEPEPVRVARLAAAKADAVIAALQEESRERGTSERGLRPSDTAENPFLHGDLVVIGCDSMLLLDGRLQGKPADADEARRRWAAMAGRDGLLLTGHAVRRVVDGQVVAAAEDTGSTVVRMGRPSRAELDAYLATGEPMAVAGALTIDGFGGWFVEGVDGDPSNVIGLSLPLTRRLLAGIGVRVTDLWRRPTG
ncbi:Maf family protein [Nakamurella leprariae]|uniref:Maf family protein n=1 Tax=Nakamurella leprariae TaxID=2803911 RepID=UPI002E2D5781|nr:Maf family protein [Nakamurella leprariae]